MDKRAVFLRGTFFRPKCLWFIANCSLPSGQINVETFFFLSIFETSYRLSKDSELTYFPFDVRQSFGTLFGNAAT